MAQQLAEQLTQICFLRLERRLVQATEAPRSTFQICVASLSAVGTILVV